jgi:hypothetical protein
VGIPSSDDLVELKQAGLSDKVLVELISMAEPEPDATEVVARSESVSASGMLSVSASYVYPRSYYTPVYRRYYTGAICRPSTRHGYSKGYSGSFRHAGCR